MEIDFFFKTMPGESYSHIKGSKGPLYGKPLTDDFVWKPTLIFIIFVVSAAIEIHAL